MKARIQLPYRTTKQQRETASALAKEAVGKEQRESTRRIFKMMCYVLTDSEGYTVDDGYRVIGKIEELAEEHKHDEVFWWHLDHQLEAWGYNFEKEDYEVMDR